MCQKELISNVKEIIFVHWQFSTLSTYVGRLRGKLWGKQGRVKITF